jgi:hypothetical protein
VGSHPVEGVDNLLSGLICLSFRLLFEGLHRRVVWVGIARHICCALQFLARLDLFEF